MSNDPPHPELVEGCTAIPWFDGLTMRCKRNDRVRNLVRAEHAEASKDGQPYHLAGPVITSAGRPAAIQTSTPSRGPGSHGHAVGQRQFIRLATAPTVASSHRAAGVSKKRFGILWFDPSSRSGQAVTMRFRSTPHPELGPKDGKQQRLSFPVIASISPERRRSRAWRKAKQSSDGPAKFWIAASRLSARLAMTVME